MRGDRRGGWWPLTPSATVVAAVVAGVCAAWGIAAAGDGWLARALRSRWTLIGGGAFLGSLVGLYLLVGVLWRLGRARREQAPGGEAGTAALEFVLLFPVALGIVLVMVQSVLLVSQNLLVHYSAYLGARAAIVWVPEKVSYVEPRNVVCDPAGSEKFRRIRQAVIYGLVGAGAGEAGAGGAQGGDTEDTFLQQETFERLHSLYDEPVPAWIRRTYVPKYAYVSEYTQLELRPPREGGVYGDHEDLSVTVRHTLYLSVPYANRIFSLGDSGKRLPGGDYGTEVEATCTLVNQGEEDDIDVEVFPRYVGRGEE